MQLLHLVAQCQGWEIGSTNGVFVQTRGGGDEGERAQEVISGDQETKAFEN